MTHREASKKGDNYIHYSHIKKDVFLTDRLPLGKLLPCKPGTEGKDAFVVSTFLNTNFNKYYTWVGNWGSESDYTTDTSKCLKLEISYYIP